jgi:hypothetical protein
MKYCISLVVVVICFHLNAQTVSGIIYDEDEALVAVKITNKTKNILVLSKMDGTFSIPASIKDSLYFESTFHQLKKLEVSRKHIIDDLVIELKKNNETLDDVYIENELKPVFQEESYNSTLYEQIQNDIKNNPQNYSSCPNTNMDFIAIFGMVSKLFKSKKPKNNENITYVNAKELKVFFENDSFFDQDFLVKDLNIAIEYQELFFDYLETKSISSQLLKEEEQINLIALFLDYSKEFKTIIAESIQQRD